MRKPSWQDVHWGTCMSISSPIKAKNYYSFSTNIFCFFYNNYWCRFLYLNHIHWRRYLHKCVLSSVHKSITDSCLYLGSLGQNTGDLLVSSFLLFDTVLVFLCCCVIVDSVTIVVVLLLWLLWLLSLLLLLLLCWWWDDDDVLWLCCWCGVVVVVYGGGMWWCVVLWCVMVVVVCYGCCGCWVVVVLYGAYGIVWCCVM